MYKTYQLALATIILGFSFNAQAMPISNGLCNLTDLIASESCVGVYDPANDQGVNNIFETQDFKDVYGTGWDSISKTEDSLWLTGDLGLFLPTGQGGTSGTWKVDTNAFNDYKTGDILFVLKAGTNAAAYEMNMDSTNTNLTSGSWDITSDAWNGSGLSHFTIWYRDSINVPEPSIVALFGLGLLGLGFVRRRKA